jgi:hypothetical protein
MKLLIKTNKRKTQTKQQEKPTKPEKPPNPNPNPENTKSPQTRTHTKHSTLDTTNLVFLTPTGRAISILVDGAF